MFNVKWAELIRSFGTRLGCVFLMKLFFRVARVHKGFVVAIEEEEEEEEEEHFIYPRLSHQAYL